MKREILFRGKSIEPSTEGKWRYGSLLVHGSCCYILPDNTINPLGIVKYRVDPETVGQFTGIDDRDENIVFEGDIFKIGSEDNIYTVKFDYGCFLAYEDDIQVGILAELSTMFIKKIGNIYDNSELLK